LNALFLTPTGTGSTAVVNNASPVNADVFIDSRIRFNPEIQLDNGFAAGGMLEFNTNGGCFTARRTFAYLSSARFGELRLGNQNFALADMEFREPSIHRGYTAGVVDSALIENLMLNPTGSSFASGTMLVGPDQGMPGGVRFDSINYYTPRIEGFQLGASFAPELSQNRANASAIPLENGSQAQYRNLWSVAANFNRTFDPGILVRLSGGYSQAYAPEQGGQGSSIGSPTTVGGGAGATNPYWWYVGGYVGYAGFSLGASYGRQAFRNFGGGSNNGTPTFINTVVSDGYAWTVGATYNYGPWGVGVTFLDGRNSDCNTTALNVGVCGSRDRNTILVVNGSYQLGPGVFWELGYFHAKVTGNEWNNGTFVGATPVTAGGFTSASSIQSGLQSNRATGVWTGLAIVF
jgi:predicted porin